MKKLLTIAIIGLTLVGCAASQISLTAPKGKDLDITIKTKEQKSE